MEAIKEFLQNGGWFCFDKYDLKELLFYMVAFVCWVAAYWEILRNVKTYQYVDMPVIAAAGNIVWEFLFGFVFGLDMGRLATIGCCLWFFMDVLINGALFWYGNKQLAVRALRTKMGFALFWLFLILCWLPVIYFFKYTNRDNGIGGVTAMISNIVMSALYIFMVYRDTKLWRFSVRTGWYKFLGTGCVTLITMHIKPFDPFMLSLGVTTALLDIWYLCLLYYVRPYHTGKKTKHPLQLEQEAYERFKAGLAQPVILPTFNNYDTP